MGYDRIINKFRHPFKTRDGYICALPYTDAHWLTFFELADRPDLPRSRASPTATSGPNAFQRALPGAGLAARHRPTDEWLEMFDKDSRHPGDAGAHAGGAATTPPRGDRLLHRARASTEGPITTFASPLDFEDTEVEFRRHARASARTARRCARPA